MTGRQRTILLTLVTLLALLSCASWAADPTPTSQPEPATALKRQMHVFPRVGDCEILCGDFHIHTPYSDGKLTPQERVIEAWRYGYDAIAITDHGNYKAYKEALPVAKALGLILIRGLETGINKKEHLVVLGVSEAYEPRDSHNWAENEGEERAFYQDRLREVAKAGGVVLHAHPHVGFREPLRWGIEQGLIQGIEVKNKVVGSGWNTIESHGTWCYPNGFEWALEHNLAIFANSDVHGARDGDNEPVTLVFVKKRTDKGVLDAIRARRTAAWFDGMLWGRKELLSDLVQSLVKVRHSTDGNEGGWLRVENRGPVALKAELQAQCAVNDPVEIGPYEEALIGCSAPREKLAIRWANVWISPTENLLTTHDCRTLR